MKRANILEEDGRWVTAASDARQLSFFLSPPPLTSSFADSEIVAFSVSSVHTLVYCVVHE
jgi:hypothetical protein